LSGRGSLEVEGVTLDTSTELVPKLSFAKDGDEWESTNNLDGSCVVAIDCTQDEAILSAGKARELMNHFQQLRKSAGLSLGDLVEYYFDDATGTIENVVSQNVAAFKSKFQGSVPLPMRLAPKSVVIGSDTVEVSGSKFGISLSRPAIAARDDLNVDAAMFISTIDPSDVTSGQSFACVVDGKEHTVQEGKDFWISTLAKVEATKALSWI